ncbi:YdcF family protein [Thermoleptolyngbya sichuanensis XZ-Cy5]|uniref:YdcF family protein n=1 Tax=Thermoleptolyngbya sichuanensis TaxID=2885951 RepID=UPI00240DBCB8|nr:YdcF family protein [Thermoleptolyngbya sichuanensis]MDG2616205.1 YdcF family protein [Thermoleptolyngbya sichuanensis XZ-Cy5]
MSSIFPTTRRRQQQCGLAKLLGFALVLGLGYIALKEVRALLREPEAVLVLGGSTAREQFAAEFARKHPDLPIWISSGSNPEYAEWVFSEAGIERDRLRLDYRAVDTLTNFTTLVDEFKAQGISSIYLITSDYHMRRARVIGKIVLGSRGIEFKPVEVPSTQPAETTDKVVRDAARAVLWVTTGHTGATLGRYFRD